MDAAAELGRDPVRVSTTFSLNIEMGRMTRDGTAEPVSRDQIIKPERRLGNIQWPCSADCEQDWQPYPVDPYSAICDGHTYIHTYICYQIALWVSGECEIVGRTHSLSVQHCCFMQLIISSSSVRGNGGRVEARHAVYLQVVSKVY